LRIGRVGAVHPLTYPVEELGAGTDTLAALARGDLGFSETLRQAKRPMVILGMGALARPDGAAVLNLAAGLLPVTPEWNGFNVLHTAAARVGGLDLGLVPGQGGRDVGGILAGVESGDIEAVFLIGADEIDMSRLASAFVVYQGHHGDRGAKVADVILPGAAYTEKNASWVNTEGRLQRGKLAAFPPGDAKEDWRILRALSEVLGRKVPLDSIVQVRARMAELAPPLGAIDRVESASWSEPRPAGELDRAAFASPIQDFYQTDPICRASEVMAECSRLFIDGQELGATGTHG
jgi:NADH-quinone oxidoreductase subunit G